MPRYGGVAIGPDDIGNGLAACGAHRIDGQDEARILQGKGLFDKVELPAHPADDLPVLGRVGDDSAQQGHHHRAIDEARLDPVLAALFDIAQQGVGEADAPHPEPPALRLGHLAKGLVEIAALDEEGGMRHGALDLALEHPGRLELDEAVGEHLAGAVKPGVEGAVFTGTGAVLANLHRSGKPAEMLIVAVPQ